MLSIATARRLAASAKAFSEADRALREADVGNGPPPTDSAYQLLATTYIAARSAHADEIAAAEEEARRT